MLKILHIAKDEIFINAAEFLYEKAFPNSNTFFILLPKDPNYKIKHLSQKDNFIFVNEDKNSLKKVNEIINKYDIVVLHSFDFFKAKVVKSNTKVLFNYILHGAEVFNNKKSILNLIYGKKTSVYLKKDNFIKRTYGILFHLINYGVFNTYNYSVKTIKQVNAFSVLHKEDYDLLIKHRVLTKNTRLLKFTYYPIEFIFGKDKDSIINNNNILLGNSATITNNHIEAIDIISKIKIGSRKLIIPLSYGDKNYAKIIEEYSSSKISNISILDTLIPLTEYNKILQTCGIVIMNHYRQQAVGNIIASMWMGSKVFLDTRNTFYHYLKRIGCYVYLIEELTSNNLSNLTTEQIQHNRKIIFKEINTETIVDTLQNDIHVLINDTKK